MISSARLALRERRRRRDAALMAAYYRGLADGQAAERARLIPAAEAYAEQKIAAFLSSIYHPAARPN